MMSTSAQPEIVKSRLLTALHPPSSEFIAALTELDALYKTEPVATTKRTPSKSKKKPGASAGNGTGFGGQPSENGIKATQAGLERANKEEDAQDEKFKKCFEKLRKNIPDALKSVPVVTRLKESAGFCASFLQLLRNDSLLDIGSRMDIYRSMLGVLLVLAKHPTTAEFLSHPLYQDPEDSSNNSSTCKQLLASLGAQAKVFLQLQGKLPPAHSSLSARKRRFEEEVQIVETDESVIMATIITDTVRAVDSFIDLTLDTADLSPTTQNNQSNSSSSGVKNNGEVMDLTLDDGDDFIVWIPTPNKSNPTTNTTNTNTSSTDYTSSTSAASNNNDNNSSSSASKPTQITITPESLQSEESEYAKKMIPFRFEVIELCGMIASGQTTHLFSSQTGAASANSHVPPHLVAHQSHQNSTSAVANNPKQRMTRIAKEMATLSTNLPIEFGSSVFVRVDESRMDLIKALIIGPVGTPYANGCFEFDIYLPTNYPTSPPQVLLRTTGKGTVRFNPNLYNCGKVCLSLLGTWAGPGWDPKLSTLLQVLVSIQSLILVSDPFYNEPGYQVGHHQKESATYTLNIKKQCLQHAILDQLKSPSVVFREVICAHFKHKQLSLREQLTEWGKEQPACKTLAKAIEAELAKL